MTTKCPSKCQGPALETWYWLKDLYNRTFGKVHVLVMPLLIHIPLLQLKVLVEQDHRKAHKEITEALNKISARTVSILLIAAGAFINLALALLIHLCMRKKVKQNDPEKKTCCQYFNQLKFHIGSIIALIFLFVEVTVGDRFDGQIMTFFASGLIGYLKASGTLMLLRLPGDDHNDFVRKLLAVEALLNASELLISIEISLTSLVISTCLLLLTLLVMFICPNCYRYEQHNCNGIQVFSIKTHHCCISAYLLMKSIAVTAVSILVSFTAFSLFRKLSDANLPELMTKELVFLSPAYIQMLTLVFNIAFVNALDWMSDKKYFNAVQFSSFGIACLLIAMVHVFGDANLNYQLWFYNIASIVAPLLSVLINSFMGALIEQHLDIATSLNMCTTTLIAAAISGLIGLFASEANIMWLIGASFGFGFCVQLMKCCCLDRYLEANEKAEELEKNTSCSTNDDDDDDDTDGLEGVDENSDTKKLLVVD